MAIWGAAVERQMPLAALSLGGGTFCAVWRLLPFNVLANCTTRLHVSLNTAMLYGGEASVRGPESL
jgi:hypothetical protein